MEETYELPMANMRNVPLRDARSVPLKEMTPEDVKAFQLKEEAKKRKYDIILGGFSGIFAGYLLMLLIGGIVALLTNNYNLLYFVLYFRL